MSDEILKGLPVERTEIQELQAGLKWILAFPRSDPNDPRERLDAGPEVQGTDFDFQGRTDGKQVSQRDA